MLSARYRGISIEGVVGDLDHHLPDIPRGGRRLVAFLGGTIGNYTPGPRAKLLADLAGALDAGDFLLLGTDLVKDPDRLVRAYDDSEGVTAAFNKNVLQVVNRELGADFELDRFDHIAIWDDAEQWIEMRLGSQVDQQVSIDLLGLELDLAAGEEIRTEVSAKFTRPRITTELAEAGFELCDWWTDRGDDYALSLSVRS
jgi:L-histidine N-alpha-methyltransferase